MTIPKPGRPRRLPPLNAVRAFEAAARHESFASAASELSVTPAAVSRHVKLLEAVMRRPLFERRPQSLVLTEFGQSWLAVLSEAFDLMEGGTHRLLRPQPARITVSAQAAFMTGWLMPRLSAFYREHAGVELRLYAHTEPPDLAAEGRLDGAIVTGRGNWPHLDAHFLFPDRLTPVCSPGYLAGLAPVQSPADLLGETLIVAETSPLDWFDWFANAGLRRPELVRRIVFPTGFLPAQAALNGLGIALADLSLVAEELETGRLVLPVDAPPLVRGTGWYFVQPQDRSASPGLQSWLGWLTAQARLSFPEHSRQAKQLAVTAAPRLNLALQQRSRASPETTAGTGTGKVPPGASQRFRLR